MQPNWKNRTLFHGDNLAFLRAMNSESVDLIATDPPFKKGRDFHATPDSLAHGAKFQDRWTWEDDVHPEWLDQIKDGWPAVWEVIDAANAVHMRQTKANLKRPRDEVGSDMGAFLCFMAVRLLEMRRLLKPTGSIYLHCDWTASHYLKTIMDAVFGKARFLNEIVWHYKSFHGQTRRWFARKHDVILYYTKSGEWTFNRQFEDDNTATIDYKRWNDWLVDDRYILGGNMPIQDSRFVRYLDRWRNENGREPGEHDVVYEVSGQSFDSVWDIKAIDPKDKNERYGYPTQKPLELYARIIKASTNEGDTVLDPFCGCATTPVIAELLGRRWVGIDVWDMAHKAVLDRMNKAVWLNVDAGKQPIHYKTTPPPRTDGGDEAAPFLRVKERVPEPPGPRMSRADMYDHLLTQNGPRCAGCDRTFDDSRYLELDHNTPRSDGGVNHISNRILLCGPCNRAKSNIYTLSGLRRLNKRNGWMAA